MAYRGLSIIPGATGAKKDLRDFIARPSRLISIGDRTRTDNPVRELDFENSTGPFDVLVNSLLILPTRGDRTPIELF
jgi:hypothetical protein